MAHRSVIPGQRAMALDVLRIVRRTRPSPGVYGVVHLPSDRSFVIDRPGRDDPWQVRRDSGVVIGRADTHLDAACIIDRWCRNAPGARRRTGHRSIIDHRQGGRGHHELVHRPSGRRFVLTRVRSHWELFAPPRDRPQAAVPTLLDAACWIDQHQPGSAQRTLL